MKSTLRLVYFSAWAVALSSLMARTASSEIITAWTFEVSQPSATDTAAITGIAAEAGTGTASGVHASANTDYSNPVGNGSSESFSSNEWEIGDYYQFSTSTVGYLNTIVSWDQTRSGTGPAEFKLQYSVDGSGYADVVNYTVPGVSWSSSTPDATGTTSFVQDLSSIPALNNASLASFRLVATSAPGATGGTNRVDNFVVSGAVIPEPTTWLLCGLALLASTAIRRRS